MKVLTYPALSLCIQSILQSYPDAKPNKFGKDVLAQDKVVDRTEAEKSQSIAGTIKTVNMYLKKIKAGFQLDGSLSDFGVAALYESAVTFTRKGKRSEMTIAKQVYKSAVHEKVSTVKITNNKDGYYINCRGGRTLFICMAMDKDTENFILSKPFRNLKKKVRTALVELHVPLVKADLTENLSKRLSVKDEGVDLVAQAFCRTVFELDETGAKARQTAAVGLTKGIANKPRVVKINKPFIAVMVNSAGNVEFAAKLEKSDWIKG